MAASILFNLDFGEVNAMVTTPGWDPSAAHARPLSSARTVIDGRVMLTAKRCGIRPCHLILALQMTPQTGSEPASSAAHPTVSDLRSNGMNQGRAMSGSEGSTYQYAYEGD